MRDIGALPVVVALGRIEDDDRSGGGFEGVRVHGRRLGWAEDDEHPVTLESAHEVLHWAGLEPPFVPHLPRSLFWRGVIFYSQNVDGRDVHLRELDVLLHCLGNIGGEQPVRQGLVAGALTSSTSTPPCLRRQATRSVPMGSSGGAVGLGPTAVTKPSTSRGPITSLSCRDTLRSARSWSAPATLRPSFLCRETRRRSRSNRCSSARSASARL